MELYGTYLWIRCVVFGKKLFCHLELESSSSSSAQDYCRFSSSLFPISSSPELDYWQTKLGWYDIWVSQFRKGALLVFHHVSSHPDPPPPTRPIFNDANRTLFRFLWTFRPWRWVESLIVIVIAIHHPPLHSLSYNNVGWKYRLFK